MSSNLKLGSNWKSCGIGIDMRRWAHGNARINFGFCKGDDNFGGVQRKELDDFTKSLGKQMTLVMYRMQDTENVRMKLREDRRREVREKFEREEAEEKAREERLERNRRWRQRREGAESLGDKEQELDDKEKRKLKNREWRQKRESPGGSLQEEEEPSPRAGLVAVVGSQLACVGCGQEMGPPRTILQCSYGHNLCGPCAQDSETCPLCSGQLLGLNTALMRVAEIMFGDTQATAGEETESLDFTLQQEVGDEDSMDFQEPVLDSLKEVKELDQI